MSFAGSVDVVLLRTPEAPKVKSTAVFGDGKGGITRPRVGFRTMGAAARWGWRSCERWDQGRCLVGWVEARTWELGTLGELDGNFEGALQVMSRGGSSM